MGNYAFFQKIIIVKFYDPLKTR